MAALDLNRLTEAEHALMWTRVVRKMITAEVDKVGTMGGCRFILVYARIQLTQSLSGIGVCVAH
jgi:hypothetical protein